MVSGLTSWRSTLFRLWCNAIWGIILIWPQNCQVCLVLKHFESYFVQIFVHVFALYVGYGGHSRISDYLSISLEVLWLRVLQARGPSGGIQKNTRSNTHMHLQGLGSGTMTERNTPNLQTDKPRNIPPFP